MKSKTKGVDVELLRRLPPFSEVIHDPKGLSLIAALGRHRNIPRGQIILEDDQEVSEISILVSGKVHVYINKEVIEPIQLGYGLERLSKIHGRSGRVSSKR